MQNLLDYYDLPPSITVVSSILNSIAVFGYLLLSFYNAFSLIFIISEEVILLLHLQLIVYYNE